MLWSEFKIQKILAKKIFFGKYHYKLEFETRLATYLRDRQSVLKRQNINDFITRFRNINYNYGGSWGYYKNHGARFATVSDIDEIIEIGNILRLEEDIKVTIQEQSIRIFSDSEQQLHSIARQIKERTGRLGFYAAIWRPDTKVKEAIDAGYEILTKDPGYSHKVVLRDRMVGTEVKQQLYNYLKSMGTEVKLTPGVDNILKSKGPYVFACWFRTNDPTLVSFLELISPGIVQKIVPVYIKTK